MSSKSNIDELFRDGLSNPTPHAFNENAWDSMNAMLNERDKFSWMSLGKLASAALFLSTVLIGSNIPDAQLIASSGKSIQDTEASYTQTSSENSGQLKIAESRSLESKNSLNKSANIRTNQELKINNINKVLLAVAGNDRQALPVEVVEVNNSSFESKTGDVVPANQPNEFYSKYNEVNIVKIEASALDPLKVDFAESGFDPVDKSSMPKRNIQSISVFGGITLENGLGSTGQLSANNFLYTAGFYYNIETTQNISISTGLGYRSKSGKGIELIRTQTEYGFGKTETTETLALNRLHYIDLPVELRYDIKGQHSVFAGASLSYLAGVKSALTTTHEESLQSSTNSTENTWNYQDGLNKLDAGVRLGYDYKLNQNLSIGGMVQYGLMDITSNETFEVQDNSNNMEVRVTLKYTPFRF